MLRTVLAILILCLIVAAALAQDVASSVDPDELALKSADAHEANMKEFQHYGWTIDSKLSQEGAEKIHATSTCHFNEKGELEVDPESAETSVKQKRGLRGRAQATEEQEVADFLDKVIQVTASYALMSKGQEVDFFDKATITEGTGDAAGTMTVQATDVSVPGDKVTRVIDAKTLLPQKISFEATVENVPVSGEVLYRPIEGGPNVPRMATINIPAKKAVIEAEFLDYARKI